MLTDHTLTISNSAIRFLHKKVAFYRGLHYTEHTLGVWSQYALLHHTVCFILDDAFSFDDTCGLLINPLTILGFLEIVQQLPFPPGLDKHKGIIHTAAASGLGKMLVGVCEKEGINLICVVRRKEQKEVLEKLGAKYILNQNDETFVADLKKLADALDCHLAFDAVGGDLTAKIISAMPANSTLYVYGQLGGEYRGLTPAHFMMGSKAIKGFVLSACSFYKSREKMVQSVQYMLDDIKKGSATFKTVVAKKYKLEQYKEALHEYKSYASEGKAVLYPNEMI